MKNSKATLGSAVVIALLLMTMIGGCKKEDTSTPSCSDGIKNQGETGIDCGGPCTACPSSSCGGAVSVTDADGNVYQAVSIGSQCWMGSNLKTTTYRNGTPIPHVSDGWDWWHLNTGAYCNYANDPAN